MLKIKFIQTLLFTCCFICVLAVINSQSNTLYVKGETMSQSQEIDHDLVNNMINEDKILGFGEDQEPEIVEIMVINESIQFGELIFETKKTDL